MSTRPPTYSGSANTAPSSGPEFQVGCTSLKLLPEAAFPARSLEWWYVGQSPSAAYAVVPQPAASSTTAKPARPNPARSRAILNQIVTVRKLSSASPRIGFAVVRHQPSPPFRD